MDAFLRELGITVTRRPLCASLPALLDTQRKFGCGLKVVESVTGKKYTVGQVSIRPGVGVTRVYARDPNGVAPKKKIITSDSEIQDKPDTSDTLDKPDTHDGLDGVEDSPDTKRVGKYTQGVEIDQKLVWGGKWRLA